MGDAKEMVLKMVIMKSGYFTDPVERSWNIFDFCVVKLVQSVSAKSKAYTPTG